MLRLLLHILLFALLATTANRFAHAQPPEPVAIGMLDSAIREQDLNSPNLGIDRNFMRQTRLLSLSKEETSLEELNKSTLTKLDAFAQHADMSQWQTFLKLTEVMDFSLTYVEKIFAWMDRYTEKHFQGSDEAIDRAVLAESGRSHAANVAGILTYGLEKFRLLPLSFMHLDELTETDLISAQNIEPLEKALNDFATRVSQIIKRENIKVFNISLGSSEYAEYDDLVATFGPAKTHERKSIFREIALARAKLTAQILHKIIKENPQTLFVIAAGNGGKTLESYQIHSSRIKEPNTLVVGAASKINTVTSFSERSTKYVDLYAWGERIAIPGKAALRMGTSYAAPWVARQAALLLASSPSLSVAALKHAILNEHSTASNSRLKFLKIDPRIVNIFAELYHRQCELFLTQELPPL